MKKTRNILLGILALGFLLTGCYPGGADYYADLDIVTTNYSPEYWSKSSPTTYYMPDTLGVIIDGKKPENNDTLNFNDSEFVLEQLENNFKVLGYVRLDTIDDANQPDLFVVSNVIIVKNTAVGYIPTYPWYGGGWYGYPGYGWGYPGYGYPVAYSYTTGTVIIATIDYENIDHDEKILPVIWSVGINGLLRDQVSSNYEVIKNTIDRAFKQSPYLKIK